MGSTFNLNLLALFLRAKAGAWVRRSPEQSQRKYPPPLDCSCCQDSMGCKTVHEKWPVLTTGLFEANELIYSMLKALSVKPS